MAESFAGVEYIKQAWVRGTTTVLVVFSDTT